jgi:glutaminyl-peptide cyclotransferase
MHRPLGIVIAVAGLLAHGQSRERSSQTREARHYGYQVVRSFPHDPSAFTQGLEYRGGFLYEGTGIAGRSTLRKEELATGRVVASLSLAPELFGEGITVIDGRIVQLTWQAHIGYVYDQMSFRKLRSFEYQGEGWGLANDGHVIYMSDGSAQIRYLDPVTLSEQKRITVRDGGRPVVNLNELEWVRGEIYANVWHTDRIARIEPSDGRVVGWIDLAGLLDETALGNEEAVLNGIAYDSMGDRLFVTGKLWPKIFEIRVVPR